jgi:hypothetical protein
MTKPGGIVTTIAVAFLLIAAAAKPSHAASRTRAFDGLWSVSINTQYGSCPASLRYPVAIVGGQMQQAEPDFTYQIGGVVVSSGAVAVIVSSGGQNARGYGRLTRTAGSGWWRTDSNQCSGTWNAVRRG